MSQASSFPPSLQMVFRPGRPGLKTAFLAAAALLAAGCGPRVYLINTIDRPLQIVVDGETDDWSSGLSYVPDQPVLVGFVNDGDNLYICLKRDESEARSRRRAESVTVWIDPAGGTNKVLGVKLGGGRPPGGAVRPGEPGQEPAGRPDERPEARPEEVEIISSKKDLAGPMSFERAAEKGLEIKSDFSGRSLVLEMKIPLRASAEHPLAAGIAPGAAVGIGIMTEETKPEHSRGGSGGSMGGRGGMPGGGGISGGMGGPGGMGGHGGMHGGRGGMGVNEEDLKPLKIWIKVQTAAVKSGGSPHPCAFALSFS